MLFKPYELFLAWRYLRGRVRVAPPRSAEKAKPAKNATPSDAPAGGFLSFVSWIALVGIALGVWALIVVVSVMNGFQRDVRENILGVVSHAVVRPYSDQTLSLAEAATLQTQIGALPGVVASAPFIEQQGLVSDQGRVQPVLVRGILPAEEIKVADFLKHPLTGDASLLKAGEFGAMIGKDLALNLGLRLGDRLTLLAPQAQFSPAGIMPRMRRFTVVGIFSSGLYEYDSSLMLTHINDASVLYQKDNQLDGLRLRFDDVLQARARGQSIHRLLPPTLVLQDWSFSHANFFRAVEIEKRMMFLILSIIIAVAAFNVVNQQMMLIGEKTADIAILRTLGAPTMSVVRLFLLQGFFLGTMGVLLGMVSGVITAWNVESIVHTIEAVFQIRFLSPEVYQIPDIPSELKWADVASTALVAFSIIILATLYPSYRAAQIMPAQALRHH